MRSRHAVSDPLFTFIVAGSLAISGSAWAAIDAGAQIRRYQDETQRRLTPRPRDEALPEALPPTPAEKARRASDERIHVAAFAVVGVTRFPPEEVAAVLQPFVGQTLDTAGIHAAADALNRHYRDAGYFAAKVFVPPQDVADVVRLDVYEGYLDGRGVEVVNKGERVDTAVVQGILEANIEPGEPMRRASFERALLIAEDLPGITTTSILYPGEHVGTARLRTNVTDVPFFGGNLDVDNFGTDPTGQYRLGATLYLNSPARIGDQVVTRLVTSGSRSNYGYLTYLVPVSPYGTRVGASVDYFDYDADYVTNLGFSDGFASDLRVYVTHPIIRSRHSNLNVRADLSHLRVDDRNDLEVNADRSINSVTLAFHGDDDHEWLGTGLSLFDASITVGNVDVKGNGAYRAIDEATAETDGGFTRFNLSLSRLQQLTEHWSVYARVSGQLASTNLDSSQKFYIGGPISVSGYPVGEAGGDEGLEVLAELRHDFVLPWAGTLMGGVFYQQGWIRNHKDPWDGWQGTNPIIENNFSLKSTGISLTKTLPDAWVIRGLVGWQFGDNPMEDPETGDDSDGSSDDYRAWFQVIRYF
jgi:hemolysin activation/secretion protein